MYNSKYNKDKATTTYVHDTNYMAEQDARCLAVYMYICPL